MGYPQYPWWQEKWEKKGFFSKINISGVNNVEKTILLYIKHIIFFMLIFFYTLAVQPLHTLTRHHLHSKIDGCGPDAHWLQIHCMGGALGLSISKVWLHDEGQE